MVAKEVVDKENFVRKFGLSFEKDIQWKAASSLLDHLSKSPLFKAVLVTINRVPFKLEPDIPEELSGRLNWAKRNYQYHKSQAETLKHHIKTYPHADFHPKLMKEEEDYARKFLQTCKVLESEIRDHMKRYFLIRENLFAAALFFYIYTHLYPSFERAVEEILGRRRAAKIEANLTYFVKCSEVKDPLIVFRPEFFPFWDEVKTHCCVALAEDSAGFSCDRSVANVLRKMFTTALELPKEVEIEELIHIPTEQVSIESPRRAFVGYVVESVVKRKVMKRRVCFPLDMLTGHAILFGKTRIGGGWHLFDPESIKEVIAKQKWCNKRKVNAADAYSCFLRMHNLTWEPPRYKVARRLPFIPTETEIDQLIAGCSKKFTPLLQLLKETGIRIGEASQLK